jgi:acyl transferase domain-containing protein
MLARLLKRRARPQAEGPRSDTGHPLLQERVVGPGPGVCFVSSLSVREHWVLDDHRFFGKAVMPGVAYLEMARAALERCGEPGSAVELRDVVFLAPLSLGDDERREVRLELEPEGDGYRFRIISRSDGPRGRSWREFAIGKGRTIPAEDRRHDLERILEQVAPERLIVEDHRLVDENLGPRWMNLKKAQAGGREVLSEHDLPEALAGDLDDYYLHPGLLDRATGSAMDHLVGSGAYLPFSYRRVVIRRPTPRNLFSHVRFVAGTPGESETLSFDIRLLDSEGRELVDIEEFSQKRFRDPSFPVRGLLGAAAASEEAAAEVAGLPETISPSEGAEAFRRILLGCPCNRVVVSCEDFRELLAERHQPTPDRREREEPARDAGWLSPGATAAGQDAAGAAGILMEIWREVLGVNSIGIDDNFFELGGDSVQGIQVVGRANQRGLRLSPQQLFELPTVGELAAAIEATSAPEAASDDGQTQAAEPRSNAPGELKPEDFPLAGLDEKNFALLLEQVGEVD